MKRLLLLVAALASACSLVIGTKSYVLEDGGDEASIDDAGADVFEAAPNDALDDPSCSPALGCLADAGVCGSSCGVTLNNCLAPCKTQMCKDQCASANTACRNNCAATCYACTVSASCPDQAGCAAASAN